MKGCHVKGACLPLVQIVPLRGTPSRPIGRPLLLGATCLGLDKHFENTTCNDAPCGFIPNRWNAPMGTKLKILY